MRTIYFGERGTYIYYLQLALQRAGYDLILDGIYGRRTKNALKEFLQYGDGETVEEEAFQELLPYLTGYRNYVVKEGETLTQIARKMDTDKKAIITANQIENPEKILAGEILILPYRFDVVPTNVPYSSELFTWIEKGLKARYPDLGVEIAGESVLGRPLSVFTIGNGDRQTFYNASFHANEWITTPVLLKFAEEYLKAYALGRKIYGINASYLFKQYKLFLMPLVNPDGVDLVNGVLENEKAYWKAEQIAADYPMIPFPSGWKANIEGTDLNLQFPAGWEDAKKIKESQGYVSPAPRDYVGKMPLSAPESKAVYEYTLKQNFGLILAYHTQGEVIYWKYLDFEPKDSRKIAEYFRTVSGYEISETPSESGYAGYKDWFILYYNRPGYTIEAGMGVNPLPLSQFDQIYNDNRLILLGGMTEPDRIMRQMG